MNHPLSPFPCRRWTAAGTATLVALVGAHAFAQTAPRSVVPSVQPSPQPMARPAGPPLGTAAPGTAVIPGTAPGVIPDTSGVAPAPAGGAGVARHGVPAMPQAVPSGPGPYTALQLAQSFRQADANLDGELTRAEAQRLTIMPTSFEEMDRNKDGILTRSEYEDGVR